MVQIKANIVGKLAESETQAITSQSDNGWYMYGLHIHTSAAWNSTLTFKAEFVQESHTNIWKCIDDAGFMFKIADSHPWLLEKTLVSST